MAMIRATPKLERRILTSMLEEVAKRGYWTCEDEKDELIKALSKAVKRNLLNAEIFSHLLRELKSLKVLTN